MLLSAQQVEESYQFQNSPDPRARVGDSQRAVDGSRHVERPDQLTHARGVDSRHLCQVHDDRALAALKQRADFSTQRPTDGHAKRTFDADNDRSPGTQFQNGHGPSSPGKTCAPGPDRDRGFRRLILAGARYAFIAPGIPKSKTIEDTEM